MTTFEEFPWWKRTPDVSRERLCEGSDRPDDVRDTTYVGCLIEGDSFLPDSSVSSSTGHLVVLAWNLERGIALENQIAWLCDPMTPDPDILLLTEADRGCRRSGFRHVVRDIAEAMGRCYAYATEFVELPPGRGVSGPYDPPLCEHGNAIISRYPLGNVRQLRHVAQTSWYASPDDLEAEEPRLGGRVTVVADVRVGHDLVRVYCAHLESRVEAQDVRDSQACEIVADCAGLDGFVIVGGDLNAYDVLADLENDTSRDPVRSAFLEAGFSDAHDSITGGLRVTTVDPVPLVIDFLFVRGFVAEDPGIGSVEGCRELSDHLPIWAMVKLP